MKESPAASLDIVIRFFSRLLIVLRHLEIVRHASHACGSLASYDAKNKLLTRLPTRIHVKPVYKPVTFRACIFRTNQSATSAARDRNGQMSALGVATLFKSKAHNRFASVAAEGGCVAVRCVSSLIGPARGKTKGKSWVVVSAWPTD